MALCTTEYVMQVLRVANRSAELVNYYDLLRQGAEKGIKSYCKWDLEYVASQTDFYSGAGATIIPIRRPYVTAISAVYVDQAGAWGQANGSFGAGTALTLGRDYALVIDADSGGKSGQLVRLTSPLPWFFPSDYFFANLRGGLSYQQSPYWPAGFGNIKVVYSWGFATIPEDIQLAVVSAVGSLRNTTRYGYPASSESLGAHSISLAINKEPEFGSLRQLLGVYRDLSL